MPVLKIFGCLAGLFFKPSLVLKRLDHLQKSQSDLILSATTFRKKLIINSIYASEE